MNIKVETYNELIGFHCWENAPEKVSFLRNKHRHRFEIRCWFEVTETDREIEIFIKEREIDSFLKGRYCRGNTYDELDFGGMSCEMIAIEIIKRFDCESCEVLEDGKGGAYVRA